MHARTSRTEALLLAFADGILRWRAVCLVVIAIVSVVMVRWIGSDLVLDTSLDTLTPADSPPMVLLEEFRDDFGRDEVIALLIAGDVFSTDYLQQLSALTTDLEELDVWVESVGERNNTTAQPHHPAVPEGFEVWDDGGWAPGEGSVIDAVVSLTNIRRVRARGDGLDVGPMVEGVPSASDIDDLAEAVLADQGLVGRVVDASGEHSVIVVTTQFMSEQDTETVYRAIAHAASRYDGPNFRITYSGLPVLTTELNRLMLDDMVTMTSGTLLILIGALVLIFRHPLGVVGPVFVVCLSVVWMFGVLVAIDLPMSMLSNILPTFVMCVGVGDSVHLMSIFRDLRHAGADHRTAILRAVAVAGPPMALTTLTSALGLLSLRLSNMPAVADLGLAAALGVAMALVHSLVLLPILLSFAPKIRLGRGGPLRTDRIDRIDSLLAACLALSNRPGRRRVVLVLGAVVTVVSLVGISQLRSMHDPLSWIPDGDPVGVGFQLMDDHMQGTASVHLIVEAPDGGDVRQPSVLQAVDELVDHIGDYRDPATGLAVVGSATSLVNVVKETHQAFHGGDPAAYRLPVSSRAVRDALFFFENAAPDQLRRSVTTDFVKMQVTLRIRWLEATAYGPLTDHIDAGIDTVVGDRAVVRATGSVYNMFSVFASLLSDLARSFGFALVVISMLMVGVTRSLRLGIVAMVPNLLPVVFVLGIMGWLQVPLDINNLLFASIAIGLVVDDTIHFLHHYRAGLAAGEGVEGALQATAGRAGRAIIATSLILASSFLIYACADMANVRRLGSLLALTVTMALVADLVLLPALLRELEWWRGRTSTSELEHP